MRLRREVCRGRGAGQSFRHAVPPGKKPARGADPARQLPCLEAVMNLYPAIDLKDGACVRLLRGEMASATAFNNDPADQAVRFATMGFDRLHVVDLNGAFDGMSVNHNAVA